MAFAVYTQQTDGFHAIILEDNIGLTRVTILPEFGASLHSMEVQTADGALNIIDNYASPDILHNQQKNSFKSCKLSPFACRIPAGTYTHNGQDYKLDNLSPDGFAMHGLLYNKAFKILEQFSDDDQASAVLKYSYKKEDNGYPFEYRCEVTYVLTAGSLLKVQTTILNLDDETMPLADGWHPYFKLGGKTDDWMLQFNASSVLEFNEKLVPTGKLLPNNRFKEAQSLAGVELDNSFVLDRAGEYSACTLYNANNKLSVSFFPDAGYPYLQIYTPSERDSIAIENLSGAPDCFNNKIGLLLLPPRVSKTFTVYYKTNIE